METNEMDDIMADINKKLAKKEPKKNQSGLRLNGRKLTQDEMCIILHGIETQISSQWDDCEEERKVQRDNDKRIIKLLNKIK